MPKFHVFGEYWKDLDHKAIYSKHIEAENKREAKRLAWLEIKSMNHGLTATIEAYPE